MLEHSAGAVIYRKNAQHLEYLIVQSVKDQRWGFPKGHLEGKETEKQAAMREVKEEAGIAPHFDFAFKHKLKYWLPNKNEKEVTLFIAKALKNAAVAIQPSEIQDHKWVTSKQAVKYLTEHGKMQVLRAAEKYLKEK